MSGIMAVMTKRIRRRSDGMSHLEDFGVVDDTRTRYKNYASAASKLGPKERAAWWKDVFQRDPDMLEFFRDS
jgi:hypothetical protein